MNARKIGGRLNIPQISSSAGLNFKKTFKISLIIQNLIPTGKSVMSTTICRDYSTCSSLYGREHSDENIYCAEIQQTEKN